MYRVKSVKTVKDESRVYTSNHNDDNSRSFVQFNILSGQTIEDKILVTNKNVDNISQLMDRISVNPDGLKFTGVGSREKEVYVLDTNQEFDLESAFLTDKVDSPTYGSVTLVSPTNGTSFGDLFMVLTWSGSDDRFIIQVSDDNFTNNIWSTVISGKSVMVTVPRYLSTYQWRVAPTIKGKVGNFTNSWSFSVTTPIIEDFNLLTPDNGKDNSPLNEHLSWEPANRAKTYDVTITAELSGTTNSEGYIIDQNGNITDDNGDVLIEYGYMIDDVGRIIDKNGNIVNSVGQVFIEVGFTVHPDGYIIDKNGNIVNNSGVILISSGYTVDGNGDIISDGNTISKESLIDTEIPAPYPTTLLPGETVVNDQTIVSINTTNTGYTPQLPYYDTVYTWTVTAKNDFTSYPPKSRTFQTESADIGDFDLIYPSYGQVITDTIFTNLQWSAAEFATEYVVKVSEDGFLTSIIDTIVQDTQYETQGLSNNKTYSWSVKPLNRTKEGTVKVGSFSFDVPSVTIPITIGPIDGLDPANLNLTLQWTPTPNADYYILQVSKDNFTTLDIDIETPNSSFTLNNLQPDTTYKWSLKSVNSVSISDAVISSFTTESNDIGSFNLLSPTSGETINNTLTPNLSWSAAPNATSYNVEVSEDNFLTFVDQTTVNNTSYITTLLTNNTTYQWRVTPTNRTKTGQTISSEFNTLLPDVTPPLLISPSENAVYQEPNLTLFWTPVFGTGSYDVDVSTNNFSSFIANGNPINTSFGLSGLNYDTTYQWRVRSRNDVSTSDYSIRSFTTRPQPYLTLSRSSASFSYTGGSTTFSVSSNINWSVSDNRSWISVSGADGVADDTSVSISVSNNSSYSSRSGTITVTGENISRTIFITQGGAPVPTATPTPIPTATPTPTPTPAPSYSAPSISVSVNQTYNFGINYRITISRPSGSIGVRYSVRTWCCGSASSTYSGSFTRTVDFGDTIYVTAQAIYSGGITSSIRSRAIRP